MSAQRVISTTESPYIVIESVAGDLSIRGWGRQEVAISANPERIDVQPSDEALRINLRDDAALQIPVNSRLLVQRIDGDISVRSVSGPVALQKVSGDVSIRDTGPLTIENVGDDLSVRLVHGDCVLGRIEGDASVAYVAGNLTIEHVDDDLDIGEVRGSVRAAGGDDVSLRLSLLPGCTYDIRAANDLSCRIPAASSARISLKAGDSLKVNRLEAPPFAGNSATFQLAEGEAALNLEAGDDLTLVGAGGEGSADFTFDFGPDVGARFAEFAQQIAIQIEEGVSSVARQVDDKLNSMGGGEDVASRIQERILAAARRAEEKISEAMRNAEMRAQEAEQRGAEAQQRWADAERPRGRGRSGWSGPGWGPPPPVPSKPARPAQPPASEAERLAVLRMVSDGSISVEQAEKLLAALNNRGSGD